jgi:hypothetical protein
VKSKASGGGIADYASWYGVSQGAARIHLTAVFAKTAAYR